MRVLIVEDDVPVAQGLKQGLQQQGYTVDIAGSAEFDTGATEGQYVLVWITDLGSGPPRVLTEIDEITVLGS